MVPLQLLLHHPTMIVDSREKGGMIALEVTTKTMTCTSNASSTDAAQDAGKNGQDNRSSAPKATS